MFIALAINSDLAEMGLNIAFIMQYTCLDKGIVFCEIDIYFYK